MNSAPPAEVIVYWCERCYWMSLTSFNAGEGRGCVCCMCEGPMRPLEYEIAEGNEERKESI